MMATDILIAKLRALDQTPQGKNMHVNMNAKMS